MTKSALKSNPKSKVLIPGYINIYSQLNSKEQRQHYYKTLYKSQNPNWDETQVFLTKKFAELVKPDSYILDAGCGNGNYVIDENRKNIDWAVGVDVDYNFVQKNICLDEIQISNLEKLPFKDDTFDAVVSLWVLEHLKNPTNVFKEINRVLKPGGCFMFATPNKRFLPLVLIASIKNKLLNFVLNWVLFGRNKKDIFETYYLANTKKDINKLSGGMFVQKELKYNYDPSYTAFNNLTFSMFNLVHKVSSLFRRDFTYAHIVGILEKR